ncbi:hypothetical protein BP5796_05987 [Coleophoma crateriformis]|uniref:Uncharacterized protein n=1 Tax=Coleophoma crateriformis TaxID=565419 RepID=A0A3D8RVV8_9HELO|nr:hypothetical protein BP5796_05987 [Coleophoma crateriformis]
MECRRRSGKRRMAYTTQDFRPPAHFLAALWGPGGDVDITQWQWEAPVSRPLPDVANTRRMLPKWLADWNKQEQELENTNGNATYLQVTPIHTPGALEDMFRQFQRSLQETGPSKIDEIFEEFQKQLSYSLSLGAVSDEMLSSVLQETPRSLANFWQHRALLDEKDATGLTYSALCGQLLLPLYISIWGSLKACKVLQPVDHDSGVMADLFSAIAPFAAKEETQIVLRDILQLTSSKQHHLMESGIVSMVRHWTMSWLKNTVVDSTSSIAKAEQASALTELLTRECDKKVRDLEGSVDPATGGTSALESLNNARLSITTTLRAIKLAQNILEPWKASSGRLAEVLDLLPTILISKLLPEFCDPGAMAHVLWYKLRYRMLLTFANMRYIDDDHLIKAWLKFEAVVPNTSRCYEGLRTTPPLSTRESCEIILNHWISQRYVTDGDMLRNHFDASMPGVSPGDLGLLLASVDACREKCWVQSDRLFDMLIRLGKHGQVVPTLKRLLLHGTFLHPLSAAATINKLAACDIPLAWTFYRTFQQHAHWVPRPTYPRTKWEQQRDSILDGCAPLVIGMVNNSSLNLKIILKALGVGTMKSGRSVERQELVHPLQPQKVKLLRKLALAIAHCERRNPRVLIRNIQHINEYLRHHDVSPHPSITRAFTHACITKNILHKSWIGTERARWVLSKVKTVEGAAVADALATTVSCWQQQMLAENEKDDLRNRAPLDLRGRI